MAIASGSHRIAACLFGIAAGCLLPFTQAAAFPLYDQLNPGLVPAGGELAAPDVEALRHQMGLLSGFGSAGLGWTIVPRITIEEAFNDNIFQAHSPRRWDLTTVVAPGIAISGDTSRIQLRLDYQPTLQLYLRSGSDNALSHQLSLSGNATLKPNLLYLDVRGLAGVTAASGGVGGLGTLGQPNLGTIGISAQGAATLLSLSKQNLGQTTSFSVSPYILHGYANSSSIKIGISLSNTTFSQLNGFTALPFETGSNSFRQSTVEEFANYQTGNTFARIRDSLSADAQQAQYAGGKSSSSSQSEYVTNRVDYAFNAALAPYVWFGWQRTQYSGASQLSLNGPQWGIGVVMTPNADTTVDVSYGRLDNSTSFRFNAVYAATARTTLTGSYNSGVTTQTGLLLNQLNSAVVSNNGGLVNGQTGGSLFNANNSLGTAPGVYRFNLLTLGATTVLERDTVTLTLSYSEQSPQGINAGAVTEETKTAGASWTHLVNPNFALTTQAFFSTGKPGGSVTQNSLAASLSGQYTLTATLSAFAQYAFYGTQSRDTALSMYQDLLIVGVTKQF